MCRTSLRTLIAVQLVALAVSCGSPSGGGATDASSALGGDAGTSDGGDPAFTGPLPLSLTAYRHVRDSDGSATVQGGETWLGFHFSGAAFLVVSTDDDGLSYEGTYSTAAGGVKLHFAADGFARDGEFTFDPSALEVTLPFKVFSEGPGSSTWERADDAERLPLLFFLFFDGATYARTAEPEAAIDFAAAHAESLIGTDGNGGPSTADSTSSEPVISRVERLPNGVKVYYSNPPSGVDPRRPLTVILFSRSRFNGTALSLSPLASDPRVFIDLPRPQNPADDPPRTAVLIAPFYSAAQTDWYDLAYFKKQMPSPAAAGQLEPLRGPMADWASWLRADGYDVQQLLDGDADVGGLVRTLAPGAGIPTPGFIFFNTHGGNDMVAVGTKLADRAPRKSFLAEVQRLQLLYPDLVTFRGGTLANPLTLGDFFTRMTRAPKSKRYYLSITPVFWDWLREMRGADFKRSFFYLAACNSAPAFADPLVARAFFGHRGVSTNGLEQTLLSYFIRSMERPTHTAEESYYNILRVQNTGQMIYKEDKLLDGKIFTRGSSAYRDANSLAGYGLVDGGVWPFEQAGWLSSPDTTPQGIWWLLFGARWSSTAQAGAQSLLGCWQDWWSRGNPGGLAAPGCNAMTPGYVPHQNEVGYASYLLTGTPVVPFDALMLSRFTLRDGDAP